MKRIAMMTLPLMLGTAALAQTPPPVVEDTDGNGTWSMAELQVVWTELTEDGFKAVDANADGAVDAAELQAAWDNGLLSTVDG